MIKVIEWFLGTICLFLGSLYLFSVNPAVLGATNFSVGVTFALAFLFYLITGYLWIGLVSETVKCFDLNFGKLGRGSKGEEMPSIREQNKLKSVQEGELTSCGSEGC